jgi:signal peptidase I
MAPTIAPGEQVTVDFLAYARSSPRRWEVVAVEAPPLTNVIVFKRVIGLPGESLSLTGTGIVVDGVLLRMPPALSNVVYCPPESLPSSYRASFVSFPYTVPSTSYFLIGDNWKNSYDSRSYGALPGSSIVGRVRDK